MAIEAYGSITITDLIDTATYIYYSATGSSTASEWHINPLSDDKYIGFYNGSPVDSGQPTTPTATIMSDLKVSEYVGSDGISITNSVQVYYFNTSNPSIAPSSIADDSVINNVSIASNQWTKSVPQYYPDGVYWTCTQNFYSSGTPSVKSTTPQRNQALTDSCGVAYAASSLADEVNNRTKYFWNDSSGTHMAAGITSVSFDTTKPSTWGYNTGVAANNLTMGYNDKVGVSLTSSSLNFYRPNTTTIDATLNANGLKINNGSIQLGSTDPSATTSGNVTLSNVDFSRKINNITRPSLRLAIGSNFGVKNDGTLYASSVDVSGAINATSLTISSAVASSAGLATAGDVTSVSNAVASVSNAVASVSSAVTSVSNAVASVSSAVASVSSAAASAASAARNASYSVEIKTTSFDPAANTATLVAVPQYLGSTNSSYLTNIKYAWYQDSISGSTLGSASSFSVTSTLGLNHTYFCVISD